MTSFEVGFIKYAEECGLSETQATHMFKRAMEYPPAQQMFKELPAEQPMPPQMPQGLGDLAALVKQHFIDQQFQGDKQKIQL